MTTIGYSVLRRHCQAALVAVKREHCAAPRYRPAQDITATMDCPKYGSRLKYFVRAANGLSNGRCVASCGVEWHE